jgi:hypothetical protein
VHHTHTTNNERGRRCRLSNYISLLGMSVCLDHRGSNIFNNQFLHQVVSTCLLQPCTTIYLVHKRALQRNDCSNSRRHETCMPSWNTVHWLRNFKFRLHPIYGISRLLVNYCVQGTMRVYSWNIKMMGNSEHRMYLRGVQPDSEL